MRAVFVVLTTVPGPKSGRRIAEMLVRRKLAACVSVGGTFRSVYRWKGNIESARESLVLIKTSKKNFGRVEKLIKKIHPYEVPEILGLPVHRVSAGYSNWLTAALR